MNNTNKYYTKSEQVYHMADAKDYINPEGNPHLQKFREYTTYYQTYGGGPEGGYFVRFIPDEDGMPRWGGCWRVSRSWGQPFTARKMCDVVGITYAEDSNINTIRLVKQRRPRQTMAPMMLVSFKRDA